MGSEEVDVPALAVAIGEAIDVLVRRTPSVTTLHVCEALGAIGGTLVGRAAAAGDEAHLAALVTAYAATLVAVRRNRG